MILLNLLQYICFTKYFLKTLIPTFSFSYCHFSLSSFTVKFLTPLLSPPAVWPPTDPYSEHLLSKLPLTSLLQSYGHFLVLILLYHSACKAASHGLCDTRLLWFPSYLINNSESFPAGLAPSLTSKWWSMVFSIPAPVFFMGYTASLGERLPNFLG